MDKETRKTNKKVPYIPVLKYGGLRHFFTKKENVSASTKSKSKTTEPTTDSVNGKHSEVKSADYNSSLPQTNNNSSLAGVLAGSVMIATMSTLGIAYKKKQN